MNQREEKAYEQGHRAMASRILMECARELGEKDPLRKAAAYIAERERVVQVLREVCAEHGDNDWPDNLHLADVIEKHLVRHLNSGDLVCVGCGHVPHKAAECRHCECICGRAS